MKNSKCPLCSALVAAGILFGCVHGVDHHELPEKEVSAQISAPLRAIVGGATSRQPFGPQQLHAQVLQPREFDHAQVIYATRTMIAPLVQ